MSGQTNLKSWLVISVVLVVLWTAVASGGVIYVDASASPGGNGQTWGTAYKYLQDALYKPPTGGDEIWVAAGTYKPDADEGGSVTPNDRTETFQLINGVQMYGGFPSGGGTWEQRDPTAYETILTGDINVPADNNDNSYHVVTGSGTDATAVLDGFTITSGNANVAVFPDQHGGGMYNYSGSPTVTNCTFSRNSARYCGGGMYNRENSAPLVTNCTLSGNGAEYGGGMYNYQSTPTLTNCVFSGNSGSNKGGGLYNHQGSPRVTNCILWGNSDNGGTDESAQIYNESSTPVINYCCVQGWTGALGGTGNIGDDPNFVDPNGPDDIAGTEDDNLRLSAGSPCIDVGDNSAIPPDTADLDGDGNTTEPIPFDLDGNARILGNVVDMGAYEDENPTLTLMILSTSSGSVSEPGEGNFQYSPGTFVPVVAEADPCCWFVEWTGTAVVAGKVADPCAASTTVTIDADYTLVANFDTHMLTVSSTSGGIVTSPGEGVFLYPSDTVVAIVAQADPCCWFVEWTGTAVDAGKVADPCAATTTVTIDADYTLVANFDTHMLTVSSTSGGIVTSPGEGVFLYPSDTVVAIVAQADPCYGFVEWTGTAVDAGKVADTNLAITTVTIDANYTLTANFLQTLIYVDAGASGNNDGSSWADGYNYLQDALADANGTPWVDEIRVAEGTYLPDASTAYPGGTGVRGATFSLVSGVAVYGGFPSGGGSPESRDPNTYETILSGNINVPADSSDNSYHVVTADGTDANTILDGFTIAGGNANGSSPHDRGGGMYVSGNLILANCTFTDNYADSVGGGMYYYGSWGDRAAVVNCKFIGNWADGDGGGISAVLRDYGTEMTVTNCIFIGNWAGTCGGGISLIHGRSPGGDPVSEVVNCTFYWNDAADGGGIYANTFLDYGSVTNCILWADWPNEIAGSFDVNNVNYCCLQYWDGGGGGNITRGVFFVDPVGPDLVPGTGDEDLHLAAYSLCIDAGDNNSVPADTADLDGDGDTNEPLPFDLDGDTRLVGCRVDMGAYESRVPGGIIYVDDDSSGADNGTSWGNAYNHLQDALAEANSNPCVSQIWVAEGTYYADANSTYASGTNEREATFQLISGVAIYGGFPSGGDPNWNDRDPNAYETILSGDINTPGDNNDNSYHVVTGSSTDATAVLDGFTITAGNANGSYPNYHGGGMHNAGGSPTVTNCVFIGNFADSGGGMCNTEFSKPTVSNCIFTENSADGKGGGMFNFESDPAVSTCTFSVNWGNYGGGMCSRDFSNPIITNCTFIGNLANYGGGMWNRSQAATTLVNCTFSGNSSENDASAIINIDCNTTATNCIFSGHSGGRPAIYIFNYNQSATLILTNCTFQGNSSTLACGSDAQNYPSSVLMTNCILWEGGDEIWNSDGSIITINYSDVQGGWGGPGSNNIDDDPCFVDADGPDNIVGTEDDNLRLLLDSPCIDAGDNNSLPPDTADLDGDGNTTEPIPLDLGGKARILYSIVDMGAYEYGRVLFVNANAQGPAHNGLSWATAYKYLQDALAYANSNPDVNEIWVAQGIYHPDASSSYPGGTDDREASFELINGVGIYGGFAGHESSLHERDWQTNETILSGDLHSNDVDVNDPCDLLTEPTRADNSYHVVTGSETDQTAILDGFTITAGNANGFDLFDDTGGGVCNHDGARPTIRNCKFNGNSADSWGGGMCNDLSTPTLINCTFIGNSAKLGGGIVNYYWHPAGGPKLIHCTFSGNSAQYYGGGMCNLNVSPVITNCNFSGNSASLHGGGMWNEISEPNLTNCTFAGNSATNGNALACDSYQQSYPSNVQLANCILWDGGNEIWNNDSSTITITYSDVQGGWSGPGGNNISANPVFVDRDGADNIVGTDDDNLRLLLDSPCIDAGDNNSVPADTADVDGDLDGNPRIVCSIVDMGTYEFNYAYMGDFDYDCDVDFADFAIFALAWLTEPPDENWNPFCDISIPADSYIDWRDLKVLTDNWLAAK